LSAAPDRAAPLTPWAGLLAVDKPAGITSHDVVARARRQLGTRAIGHLGTLDPAATGLLVLLVGAATRCATVWQGGRKSYAGVARFGVVTDSQDLQGRVLSQAPVDSLDPARILAASQALTGDLLQVPPMVSALKHRGERLHAIARRGEQVPREPRAIHVEQWVWTSFAPEAAEFVVHCSGGTYVRTLVHDLGAALGTGAALAGLRRLASAPFSIEQAVAWSDLLEHPGPEVLARHGIPLDRALGTLPAVTLDAAQSVALGHGQTLTLPDPGAHAPLAGEARSVVLRSASGRALALGGLHAAADGRWQVRPQVVFPWAVHGAGAA